MGTNYEMASGKLAPFVPAGTSFVVAVPIRDAWGDTSESTSSRLSGALEAYLEARDLDPQDDILRHVGNGWLGLTDDQILVARQKLFGSLKPKHLLVDLPKDAARVEWYDADRESRLGGKRVLVLSLDDGRFAIVVIWLPNHGKDSYVEELREAAEAVVDWLGEAATDIHERAMLYSTTEFKKGRLRYFTEELDGWEERERRSEEGLA